MTREQLTHLIQTKQSYLCVGLDTDEAKIPAHLRSSPDAVLLFNKAIIDATRNYCVSYKINTAFYEALGARGWEYMQETVEYIGNDHFIIADAKRGDIGNTSAQYAKAFFEVMSFDAITVAPYMGEDSVRPFLEYEGKWAIVLGLTSNKGAADFEMLKTDRGYVYEQVLHTVSQWGTPGNLMFVIGATQPDEFLRVRKQVPDHFLLVPGVGAQGGSLREVSEIAMNKDTGLLVNVSRAILYASQQEDFAEEAAIIAQQYQIEMKAHLSGRDL